MSSLTVPKRGEVAPIEYQIIPDQIVLTKIDNTIFGNNETTQAARQLVLWAKSKNGWQPFTQQDISQFLSQGGRKKDEFGFLFGALLRPRRDVKGDKMVIFGGGWIVQEDDKFHFTTGFIEACYQASISLGKKPPKRVVEQWSYK